MSLPSPEESNEGMVSQQDVLPQGSKLADKQNGGACMEQFVFVLRGANSFHRMGKGVCCV